MVEDSGGGHWTLLLGNNDWPEAEASSPISLRPTAR